MNRLLLAACLAVFAVTVRADTPAPRAARSVHLSYPAPDSSLFYNEVTVDESVPGSYFCAAGFAHGYFGMQELGNGKKVVIFSIWEPGKQDDPNAVPADRRVELLAKGPGVRDGRFGGEGTGGQSFYDYAWKTGETCRFLVRAVPEGQKTTFSAYFYVNPEKRWQHMATFRTLTSGSYLKGYYSFVEDFRRDGKSFTQRRSARYGNGWVQTVAGDWQALTRARFTGDSTTLTENIDAGVKDGRFYLVTGGETKSTRALRSFIDRSPVDVGLPDFGLAAPAPPKP
ncbi:MAG: hypothetical protein K0Q72_5195 [Armatimonadetes bacterium]|jgi:hypothetical protein|nr:hypothetical protein [Armatimonadota bacterium]